MQLFKFLSILLFSITILSSCSGTKALSTENPESQASVIINLKNGSKKSGIVLKREGDDLVYIDAQSHSKEKIAYKEIKNLEKSAVYYDFEGYEMPNYAIKEKQGMSSTLLYGGGGLLLGAAVGTGVGIGLLSADVDVPPIASIAAFGVAGAIYFGYSGAEKDYENAIFELRKERYKASKAKRDKEIEKAKKELKEQKARKKELLDKIKDKKQKK